MPMTYQEQQPEPERRFDPETIRKVTALAARLQREHQDTLTADEMEAIGLEVGLQPAFIHQAIAHLEAQHQAERESELENQTEQTQELQETTEHPTRSGEFVAALCALALPLAWGPMAYMWHSSPGFMTLFTLLTPAPLTALMGFLTGRKKLATLSAALLLLSLSPTFPYLYYRHLYPDQIDGGMMMGAIFLYNLFGIPAATYFGSLGASLRQAYFPLAAHHGDTPVVSKEEMQSLLTTMQQQSALTPMRHAFLSVEVCRPFEMRASGPTLTVDHTFGQYQRWADEVAQGCGGMLQNIGGDARLFLFPSEASALRAARRMQEGIQGFNVALNRLPLPFRLRCGVSAGESQANAPGGANAMNSPAIDRAIFLQQRADPDDIVVSGEAAATGLIELGNLSPLPESLYGPNAFSWRTAQQNAPLYGTSNMTA